MPMTTKHAENQGRYLRITEAAELAGVNPDTLRRWADAGKVKSFRTPSGERRFLAADMEALMVPSDSKASR